MDETPKIQPSKRLAATVARHRVGFAALALLIVAVGAILASKSGVGPPSNTPVPTPGPPAITARRTGELGVLAGTSDKVKAEASSQIAIFLKDFYERSFLGSPNGPEALVEVQAMEAFNSQRDAFANGVDVAVSDGTVGFEGLLYTDKDTVLGALLSIKFTANGRFTVAPERLARLSEHGQLLLHPTPEGWRLGGFDVVLNVDSAPMQPSASPVALSTTARWMP